MICEESLETTEGHHTIETHHYLGLLPSTKFSEGAAGRRRLLSSDLWGLRGVSSRPRLALAADHSD